MTPADAARIALAALALSGPARPAAAELEAPKDLSFQIAPVRTSYRAAQALGVRFTMVNRGATEMNVLTWQTPLEGFNADIFDVRRGGERVPYLGRTVKRAAPRPEDYVTVPAGGSLTRVVDLGQAYAVEEPGDYSAELRAVLLDYGAAAKKDLAEKRALQPRLLRSNAVTLRVAQKRVLRKKPQLAPPPPPAPGAPAPKVPAYRGCSPERQGLLATALDGAQGAAAAAREDLALAPEAERPGAQRYLAWFGAYQAARWGGAEAAFDKIADALSAKPVLFDCGCTEPYYAYVYPAQPYEIYLCTAFWTAPASGTDSRLGTLVHETSHFYAVAGTGDHAYGKGGCQGLAQSDPALAVANADCYEYFAENDPPLPMPRPPAPEPPEPVEPADGGPALGDGGTPPDGTCAHCGTGGGADLAGAIVLGAALLLAARRRRVP